ncbi:hypothetical protein KKA15_04825 [Patescibacteria group bacterium]|nr:hypothetical protein [Patescibacteria group bacterium]
MKNIELIKNPQMQKHIQFTLGAIVGTIFGIIIGAIMSYGYVTTFASSQTSITHITNDVNKLVSFSYDSNRWGKDVEKLILLSSPNCLIYPGITEVDLTGLTLSEQKLKMYGAHQAQDSTYSDESGVPQKKVVIFDITQNFGKNNQTIDYIFLLDSTGNDFDKCGEEFESILQTFTLKDVKK